MGNDVDLSLMITNERQFSNIMGHKINFSKTMIN